jgi:hypothetical protein
MSTDKEEVQSASNPNEDSMVTDNLKGKKVDANPEDPNQQPDDNSLVTNASQKGKKVDADPETEQGVE